MTLLYSLLSITFYSLIPSTKSVDLQSILSPSISCCPQHATNQQGCENEAGSDCIWLPADDPIVQNTPSKSQCLSALYIQCKKPDPNKCCGPCCGCEPVSVPVHGGTPSPITAPVPPGVCGPAPTTAEPTTAAPTTKQPTPAPICFDGQACMISGDPHTYMFNGDRHDFQGIPHINNQHYYIHPCHDANLDNMPIKVLGTHYNYGHHGVSGIDYMVVILTDSGDDSQYYVFLSSSIAAWGTGGSGGISTIYDDNNAVDMTSLTPGNTISIGNRFKIHFNQIEANKRIWVKITTDGTQEFKFYMSAQPYFAGGRNRMHFVWMSLPKSMQCEACGLCGNYKDESTGLYVEKLEACDGSYVEYRAGWSATNQPEAYDPDGWTWEYNYVENTCSSYDITNNIPVEEEIVDPCPETMAALTAAECESQMAEQSECCDVIGYTLCANLLASCKVDACKAANNDRHAIEGAVTDIMVAAVQDLCTNEDIQQVNQVIPEPVLVCPAGSIQNTGSSGEQSKYAYHYNDIKGCGMTACSERFTQETPEECEALCRNTAGCHGFSWAPIGGDPSNLDKKVCTIYESGVASSRYGNNQIFCTMQHTTCSLHSYSLGDDSTDIGLSQDGGQTFSDFEKGSGVDNVISFILDSNNGGITANTILKYKVTNTGGTGGFAANLVLVQDQDNTKTATILTDDKYNNFQYVEKESTNTNWGNLKPFGTGPLGRTWNTVQKTQFDDDTYISYDIAPNTYSTFMMDFGNFPEMLEKLGCYKAAATRVPTESPTPAPTRSPTRLPTGSPTLAPTPACVLGESYMFEGQSCIINGDPHTQMFNGKKHDFQGNPDIYNQQLYVAPCHGSSSSDMPLKILGTHYRWGSLSVSGLDYLVVILEDTTTNEEFYVFISSGIAGYLQVPAAGTSTQYEDVEADLTELVSGSQTSLGSGRFSITYTQITAGQRVSLSVDIDGEIATIYMAAQIYNHIDGRHRTHFAQISIPSSHKCHACGLCGNFKDAMTGLDVEYLETCSGGKVGFRSGWWPSITEAYDINGWTWEYNYYLNDCKPGDYDITNNLGIDPCPPHMAAATATACEDKKAELQTCCDQIGDKVCRDLLIDCKIDACIAANNDAAKIADAVNNMFGEAVSFVCDQGLDVGAAPLPNLQMQKSEEVVLYNKETMENYDFNNYNNMGLLMGSGAVLIACIIGLCYRKNRNSDEEYKSLDGDDKKNSIKLYSTFQEV